MKELEKAKKPVILTGDLNCVHEEINIFNPAGNKRSAGFTIEERQSFEMNFLSKGFVDTFRNQHPGGVGYIYWGYRHNGRKTNKGLGEKLKQRNNAISGGDVKQLPFTLPVKQDGAWITSSSQSPSPIRPSGWDEVLSVVQIFLQSFAVAFT
ncbi:hypothetical protein AgCh_003745 [Apium graveolens]